MKRRRCGDMPVNGEIFGHRTLNQQTTSTRQTGKSRPRFSWLSIFSVLCFSVNIEARQSLDLECYELLQQTRHSSGFVLGKSDYAKVVSGMARGELEPLFDQLPRSFHEHFRIKAEHPCRYHHDWGYCIDFQLSQNALPSFCQEIRSEIEAHKERAPSPSMVPSSPAIYPSTTNDSQHVVSPTYSQEQASPSPTLFEPIHQDRQLQSFQDCKINISIADSDRSNRLRKVEYVVFLSRMSNNQLPGSFTDLPQRYQDYFENNKGTGGLDVTGARPGQTATTAQTDSLTKLCDDTKDLLSSSDAPVGPPGGGGDGGVNCDGTISEQQCFIAIAISDRNRDDLLQEDDYIRFVNRLSNNEYVDIDQLGDLPSNIQLNFRNLENNGVIDIEGSKPGQSASKAQAAFLSRVCCETDLAVQDPGGTRPPSFGPNPTNAPVGPQCVSSITRQQCNIFLSIADLSKDNFLNQVEYIRFLDRLSTTGEFSGVSFDNLPAPFIANYDKFATVEGQIDVFGSKPGQTAGTTQDEFINELCCETNRLVLGEAPPPTPVPITPSPTIGEATPSPSISQEPSIAPSTAPSIAESQCFQTLQEADLFKDSLLSPNEFVRLVNLLAGNAFEGLAFEELPCDLTATFDGLSSDGSTIPIVGATSNTATDEQKQEALRVCVEVSNTISGQGAYDCSSPPSIAPDVTESPTTSPPTAGPIDGEIEIFNAFVILNTRGIIAERLAPGSANRNGLDAAYETFVTDSVGRAIASTPTLTTSLRGRRRLEVTLQADSAALYSIVDAECPAQVEQTDATCQVGYGRFRVDVTNEYAMQIIERYTNFTQDDILNGVLQSSLVTVDPNSVLQIVDAFFPVRDPDAPTSPPGNGPPQTPGPAVDGSSNTGAVVGGVFGGLFFCALCVGIGWYTNKRANPSKTPPTGGDDENSVIGENLNDDDNIVRPGSSRENVTNYFDNLKNRFVNDEDSDEENDAEDGKDGDEEDSDQEDNEFNAFDADFKDTIEEADGKTKEKEKEKKNVFGFGKKDKKGKGSDVFGLDTGIESDSSSDRGNDFGKYGFEDPDALLDSDEDGDDEDDDAGSKEQLFESNMSPAWTSAETGFGTSWGAGGSNDLANEFFDKSFGDIDLTGGATEGNIAEGAPTQEPTEEDDENEDDDDEDSNESSFGSSEDSTYESNNDSEGFNDAQNEPDNSSSADIDHDNSSSADDSQEEAEEVKSWANQSAKSGKSEEDDEDDDSEGDDDDTFDQSQYSGSMMSASSRSTTPSERQKRIEFRAQVDALVRIVLPDQMEKVDEMMDQFRGREPELISTLQNMQERSATQRARQAVHRSKTRPDRAETRADGSYAGAENMMGASEGSAAGTAAIAAASLPIPAGGFDEPIPEDDAVGFGGGDAFGGYPREEDENSFFSGDQSRDSYSDDGPSFADDGESQDRSYDDDYDDQDGSFGDDQDRSFADDRSQDRSYDGEDSRGSFFSGDGDMDDAFGGQDNAFGNDAFGSQDQNAFGSQGANDAFGSNAFGSQGQDAFGSQDANDVFGSQDDNAFGGDVFGNQDDNAFGNNAFGSNAFAGDDLRQGNDQGFGDDQDYSQGSYSEDQSASFRNNGKRTGDQGFGDDQDYSQGSYSQDQGAFGGDDRGRPGDQDFGDEEGYSQEGSYSQEGQDALGQDNRGRLGHQGGGRLGHQGAGDDDYSQEGSYSQGQSAEGYSQEGSYSQEDQDAFEQDNRGRLGHQGGGRLGHQGFGQDDRGRPDQDFGDEEDYSQEGSYSHEDQDAFEQGNRGRLGHQGGGRLGHQGFGQDGRGRPGDQDFGDEEDYSQEGSYSQEDQDAFGQDNRGRLGHQGGGRLGHQQGGRLGHQGFGQDARGRPGDQGFGDEEGYSQEGSFSQEDYSQEGSYDDEGRSYDDGGSRSYYSGEESDGFDDGGERGGERPDSFGDPPDSFGRGDVPAFDAGGWPDD